MSRQKFRTSGHQSPSDLEGLPDVRICHVYDSGYINGVSGSTLFIDTVKGEGVKALRSSHQSLIVSILSAGTFFGEFAVISNVCHALIVRSNAGALMAGDLADFFGTIIVGCFTYIAGVIVQTATTLNNP